MPKLKEVGQTKKDKEQYKHPIIDLLLTDEPKTKQELADELHITVKNWEREVRDIISTAKAYYPVIATSDRKGYRRAKDFSKLDSVALESEIDEVRHQINETKSRIKCLKKTLKPLIAWMSKAEQYLKTLEPEDEENAGE